MSGENKGAEAKTEKEEEIEVKEVKMAQLIFGKLREFVPGDDVSVYLDHVDDFFELNVGTVKENQRVQYFLNAVGTAAFNQLSIKCSPDKPKTKTLDALKQLVKDVYEVKRNVQVERSRFTNRRRLAKETINEYITQLQMLAEHCDFGNSLDDRLKTQFIAGINCSRTLSKLLALQANASLADTVNKAKEAELIAEQAKKMVEVDDTPSSDVNFVDHRGQRRFQPYATKPSQFSAATATRSGAPRAKCFRCGSEEHFARNCDKNRRGRQPTRIQQGHFRRQQTRSSLNAVYDALEKLELEDAEYEEEENDVAEDYEDDDDAESLNNILGERKLGNKPALVNIRVENQTIAMEVDTGAGVSVCSAHDYHKFFKNKRLHPCEKRLKVISGDRIQVLGQIELRKVVNGVVLQLPLIIVMTDKPFTPLLGRNWLSLLTPEWRDTFDIHKIDSLRAGAIKNFEQQQVKRFKKVYASVFDGKLIVPMKVEPVEIRMKENYVPWVHKPYSVPLAHKEKLEKHLKNLVTVGVLEKVDYAEWASPLVVVAKANKTDIRVCMDGSKTVNPVIETHHYPLPLIDELISCKAGAKKFALLDLKGAYQQLVVSERSKKLLTVNTHLGLFAYRRLPFGVKPAATIFQQVMDRMLAGIPNVSCYIDDVLCWAKDSEELAETLEKVLRRFEEYNVKVNPAKCQWFKDKLRFLGHDLSEYGVTASEDKVRAISCMAEPGNVSQLKAFIGAVSFYGKFCKNLSTTLAPLFQLLQKGIKWTWNDRCQAAFEDCKREICSERVLAHFDESKAITIKCDASDDGIGAVMTHEIDGRERPVLFVSRALTKAERNYPILHREALAMVFAMEKFYRYVFGRRVKIVTDHKPLVSIFGENKSKPAVVASRLQRYIVRLSIFDYEIVAIKGRENVVADCLSRLPLRGEVSDKDEWEINYVSVNHVSKEHLINLNLELVQRKTAEDETLCRIMQYVKNGWPERLSDRIEKLYWAKRDALNIDKGCLTFNDRVVIPRELRQKALEVLHLNHRGEAKMKQVARQFMFWEYINSDIEKFSGGCQACQTISHDKCVKVVSKWPEVRKPMERVHLDFFHFESKSFLIFIDTFTRWLEVRPMSRTTAKDLIGELEKIFAIFGYPDSVISDNGPPFSSAEFAAYCSANDIELVTSPPYNPQSNGLAERAVGTTKAALQKLTLGKVRSSFQISEELTKFLFTHRNTPTTDGIIPSHLMLNFQPKTELHKLRTKPKQTFSKVEEEEIKKLDPEKKKFEINDRVLFINTGWAANLEAKIIRKVSDWVYWIEFKAGGQRKAHWNQLKAFKPPFFISGAKIATESKVETEKPDVAAPATIPKRQQTKKLPVRPPEPVRKSKRIVELKSRTPSTPTK